MGLCYTHRKPATVFLIGPPGIGKTAIIKQIASEINVGLISYSILTIQGANILGLPFILQKNYGEKSIPYLNIQ